MLQTNHPNFIIHFCNYPVDYLELHKAVPVYSCKTRFHSNELDLINISAGVVHQQCCNNRSNRKQNTTLAIFLLTNFLITLALTRIVLLGGINFCLRNTCWFNP